MSSDLNQSAAPESRERDSFTRFLMRLLWAVGIGIVFTGFVGATVWAKSYSDAEIASVMTDEERQIAELRDQQITQLRIALGRRLAKNRRADLYYRLAEIYLEGYRATFLLEGKVHEARLEDGKKEVGIDRSHSMPFLKKGIQACRDILELKIPFSKMDQVYYFLGFNYGELGDKKSSLRYYAQLVSKYPRSPFAVEAYRELGEDAFERRQFRTAQNYFQKASAHDGPSRPRVLHKLAWAYYRTKNYPQAISTMKEAIAGAEKSGERLLSLKEEALQDMAIFMTERGQATAAVEYFKEVAKDKDYYPNVLEKLGQQYERTVQPKKATAVYESLLKTHPDGEATFRVLVKLVDLDLRRGRYQSALKRLGSSKLIFEGDTETETAAHNLKAMIRRTATDQHELYRKKKSKSALRVAEDYYEIYLQKLLSVKDERGERPEIQMYLAEVKRELGKDEEASNLYKEVVDSGDKRYAKEAAALWTASLAEAMRDAGKRKHGKSSKAKDEPSALERQFVDAADLLQKSLSETAESREAALKAAQVLAGYEATRSEAIDRAEALIARASGSTQAVTAAQLLVQIHSDRLPKRKSENYGNSDEEEELRDLVTKLKSNSALLQVDAKRNKGKLAKLLEEQQEALAVARISYYEREEDFAKAAKAYLDLAKRTDQRKVAEKAYSNAMHALGGARDRKEALKLGEQWLRRYPKSDQAIDAIREAATLALVQGRFEDSAELFNLVGVKGSDSASLETSARILEGTGDVQAALETWGRYLSQYRSNARRWNVALAMAKTYQRAGNESEAAKYYRYCVAGPSQVAAECGARLGDLALENKERSAAKSAYSKVAGQKKAKSPYVGYARYKLAELMESEAVLEELRLPDAQLKKALNQRLSFLEPLGRAYNSALEAGGPWGVAALDRLAKWAIGFADELDSIRAPASAGESAAQEFRKTLQGISSPLRAKATQTWQQAYENASQAEVLSPSLPEMSDRLNVHAQGSRGGYRIAGIPADGGDAGKKDAMKKVRARLEKNARDAGAWVDYGNLLWGEGKPLLSELAYERAIELNKRNEAAWNNRGVVQLSSLGAEDWLAANEALAHFKTALSHEKRFLTAQMNTAVLLNYYRLFKRSEPIWRQLETALTGPKGKAPAQVRREIFEGRGVALQGISKTKQAEAVFSKAQEAGSDEDGFILAYHRAARILASSKDKSECLDVVDEINTSKLEGFEKAAVDRLHAKCSGGSEKGEE